MRRKDLSGLLLPAAILVLWEGIARLELVSTYVLPPISGVAVEMWHMLLSGILLKHLGVSLVRVLAGFLIGAGVGAGLGMVTGLSPRVERLLDPTLQALRSIPSLAWVPLLLLWMGIGESPKLTLIAIGAFFPVYLSVVSGIRNVDRKLVEVGETYAFSRVELVRRIILPASLPSVMTGLRTGLGVAWLYVVAAEMIAAHSGLGFLLTDGRELSRADLIFAAILLLAGCGKMTDSLLKRLEKRLLAWRDTLDTTLGGEANG